MQLSNARANYPVGGIHRGTRTLESWRWNGRGAPSTLPQRCREDQCYLLRVQLRAEAKGAGQPAPPMLAFWSADRLLLERAVDLGQTGQAAARGEWNGWVCSPPDTRAVQVHLEPDLAAQVARIDLYAVADHDAKCHPLANVPRWSEYGRRRNFGGVLVPARWQALMRHVPEVTVEPVTNGSSLEQLARKALDNVLVLDRESCQHLRLEYADVARLAGSGLVIVDLAAFVFLVARDGLRSIQSHVIEDNDSIGCARNLFAETSTRGFALLDTFPMGAVSDAGGFALRVVRKNRAWRALASELNFEVLLESSTAEEEGDIVAAAQRIADGQLIVTDIPLLAGAPDETLIAPSLTRHLLRMLLNLPLDDAAQYWARWEEVPVILRDIAELPRRYEPLRALRWAAGEHGLAQLGITLMPAGPIRQHVVFSSGRIDSAGRHDGLPPEPMMIFMKWLAREARQRTAWFQRHLTAAAVTWLFESALGTEYVSQYPAAEPHLISAPTKLLKFRTGASGAGRDPMRTSVELPTGVLGDGSIEFQAGFTRELVRRITDQ